MANEKSIYERIRKNISLGERRTSVSLEERVWDGLIDICRREEISLDGLCTEVDDRRIVSSLSSSLRVFQLTYFRYAVEVLERRSTATPAGGLAQPPQIPFQSALETTLALFAEDQRKYTID